jgi:hypothetical protein
MQRGSNSQPTLLQKLPGGGVSVQAPKQNIAAGQAAVFAGLGTWAILQVGWVAVVAGLRYSHGWNVQDSSAH